MERRSFLLGTTAGLAVGAAGGLLADRYRPDRAATPAGQAPAVISGRDVGTTWKIQTSWPAGVGLDIFTRWCNSIVEKTGGELAFQPYGAEELVGEFRLFDAVENGTLDAMNAFTLYWSGRMPATGADGCRLPCSCAPIPWASAILAGLNRLGVSISIDDFGTGYSSLLYLTRFPLQSLKIDQSFVGNVPGNADSVTIVTSILAMARRMNLSVVAEGVETTDQLKFLRANGCSIGQGYLFSRPMEPDRVLDWYRSEFLTTICRKLFAAESALPPIDLLQAHAASAKI